MCEREMRCDETVQGNNGMRHQLRVSLFINYKCKFVVKSEILVSHARYSHAHFPIVHIIKFTINPFNNIIRTLMQCGEEKGEKNQILPNNR